MTASLPLLSHQYYLYVSLKAMSLEPLASENSGTSQVEAPGRQGKDCEQNSHLLLREHSLPHWLQKGTMRDLRP